MNERAIVAMHRRQVARLRALGEIEPERCSGGGDARRANGNPEWRAGNVPNRHEAVTPRREVVLRSTSERAPETGVDRREERTYHVAAAHSLPTAPSQYVAGSSTPDSAIHAPSVSTGRAP